MKYQPTGYVAPTDRYRVPVLFNPYTGEPRDVRDVQSDPQGILIVPPGAELLAAPQGASQEAAASTPLEETLKRAYYFKGEEWGGGSEDFPEADRWHAVAKVAIRSIAPQPEGGAAPQDANARDAALPYEYLLAKTAMVVPLLQEARDAIECITVAQRRLHGISRTLAERMDIAGTFSVEDWRKNFPDRAATSGEATPEHVHSSGELRQEHVAAAVRAEWISVEERLPPQFEEVLIAFRDVTLPATGQHTANDHDAWGWCFPKENDPEDTGPVTHWMPLPTPPQPLEAKP